MVKLSRNLDEDECMNCGAVRGCECLGSNETLQGRIISSLNGSSRPTSIRNRESIHREAMKSLPMGSFWGLMHLVNLNRELELLRVELRDAELENNIFGCQATELWRIRNS